MTTLNRTNIHKNHYESSCAAPLLAPKHEEMGVIPPPPTSANVSGLAGMETLKSSTNSRNDNRGLALEMQTPLAETTPLASPIATHDVGFIYFRNKKCKLSGFKTYYLDPYAEVDNLLADSRL